MKRHTCCTTYVKSGRVSVRYWRAPAKLRYSVRVEGGEKRPVGRGELGFGVNRSHRRVTLSHARTLEEVERILLLGQEQAGSRARVRDAEEVVQGAKVGHGELRVETL